MKKKNLLVLPGILCSVLLFSLTSTISIKAEEGETIVVGSDGINTISEALEDANDGDTIKIPAGTYNEQLCITKSITIDAEEGAVLDGGDVKLKADYNDIDKKYKNISGIDEDEKLTCSHSMVSICASGVKVEGLEITKLKFKGPSKAIAPIGIYVAPDSDDVTIEDCEVHDMGLTGYPDRSPDYNAHGILAKGKPGNAIEGLTIKSCTLYNLILGNSEALVVNGNVGNFDIINNTVYNCDNIGIDAIGYEQFDPNNEEYKKLSSDEKHKLEEADRAHNGKIHGNTVKNISSAKNRTYNDERDRSDTCAAGIYVDGGKEIDVYENYVSNCDIGIEVASEHHHKAANNINVYHNTLVENNNLAGIILGGSEVDKNGEALNCHFYNNTVYNTNNSCLEIQFAHSDSNVFDHNLFIAKNKADIYNESNGNKSTGNTISDNLSNEEIDEDDYPKVKKANNTFKLKKVSCSDDILYIESSTSLDGYGSNYRTNVKVSK